MGRHRPDENLGLESDKPALASTEMIREVLACLTEGTTVHHVLSLFKDSAEIGGNVARAALTRYREETGKASTESIMRRDAKDLLPRYGIKIVVNPDNHRWMVVLYNPAVNALDFDAEIGVLVEEIRSMFGLGKGEEATAAILFFLRQRLGVVQDELERLA